MKKLAIVAARVRLIAKLPRKPYASVLPRPRPQAYVRPTPAERIRFLSARLTTGKTCACGHSKNDHLPWRPGPKRKRECLDDDCKCTEFTPQ